SASTANYLVLKADKYYCQAQPDSALFYYNEAFEIFDTVSKDDAIWQLNNISNTQVSLGNFAEAAVALKRAIKIAKSTSNNLALGYSLQASSFLYGLTGEFEEGIKNSDSAIAMALSLFLITSSNSPVKPYRNEEACSEYPSARLLDVLFAISMALFSATAASAKFPRETWVFEILFNCHMASSLLTVSKISNASL